MKHLCHIIFALIIFTYPNEISCSESFYINEDPVLLYKVINWWYDCPQKDSELLCGNRIKYQNIGNARAAYNDKKNILSLKIHGGISDQLSLFGKNSSLLKCTWISSKYLKGGMALDINKEGSDLKTFIIKNINKNQAHTIQASINNIALSIEGVIYGLMDGKIALQSGANVIKHCSGNTRQQQPSVIVTIFNLDTNEPIIKYTSVQDSKTIL